MGRDEKANEAGRKAARQIRDEAEAAFVQALAIMSGSLALTLITTEFSGTFDAEGRPEAQTREFTVSHADSQIALEHMIQGSRLLYERSTDFEKRLAEAHHEKAAKQADTLPTPEGMEEGPNDHLDDGPVGDGTRGDSGGGS